MPTQKKSTTPPRKTAEVEVPDLKPSRDAKGGGRKQEANFLPNDDGVSTDAQKKEEDEL